MTTKTKPKAAAKKAAAPRPAPREPITVDNYTRRSDDDVLQNGFAYVIAGEHQGRYGHFHDVIDTEADGYPRTVLFVTRDENAERLRVAYKDLRPATDRPRGGR